MEKTARGAALAALLHVSENEGYSNIVLDKTLREYQLERRDSALASHIFYGVLEKRITLDYYLRCLFQHPNYVIHPAVMEILRMGAYQILFLDKVPESAAVNESVALVHTYKRESSVGFVNGILRELIRQKDILPLPDATSLLGKSICYSVPEELIALWARSYGPENAEKILESFSEKSKTYVRRNTVKDQSALDPDSFVPCAAPEEAFLSVAGGNLSVLESFTQGLFHVQDLSSQFLCALLNPLPGETILDVCAAPGGKTFTIAQRMQNTGTVFAYDLYKGRVKLIRSGAYRLGLTNVKASMRDARSETCECTNADRILCDVPCSGYGTIRRKPEIRYKPLHSLAELPNLQYDILEKSARHLKLGGLLVYSTCTLHPAENGAVADRFLKEHPEFEAAPLILPPQLPRVLTEPAHQLTMLPFAAGTDGFFVATFRKKREKIS